MTKPANPPPASTAANPWWRDAVVYQIYPRSFADASGDGIGDLPGITARLTALKDLGVDAVWLSPFYTSPQADAGYDVADYCQVDPVFGTLADFDQMLARAHDLDLKVIIDIVPNHSSSKHDWFQAALASPVGSPERERYIFRDGKGPGGTEPPNNWQSVFAGSAWTRTTQPDGSPGQWYLHLFDSSQPDFNWENPEVAQLFEQVLRFWLDRGVDGFRVDVAHGMVKAAGLPDMTVDRATGVMAFEAPSARDARKYLDGAGQEPIPEESQMGPIWDQNGVHEIYRHWRAICDEYSPDRILVAEAWVQPLSRLSHYVRPDEMHQAFNFQFLETGWYAPIFQDVITRSLQLNNRVGAPTTWVLSNHDVIRHASRFGLAGGKRPNGIGIDDPQPDAPLGLRRAKAATLTMLALPGSAYLYQGEELGLPEHTTLPDDVRQDPNWERSGHTVRGRDGCRAPIPWEANAPGLGFSPTGKTWLPQPQSYQELARDQQIDNPLSTLAMYQDALTLRKQHTLGTGTFEWLTHPGGRVVAFQCNDIIVMINMSGHVIPLPPGELLLSSGPIDQDGELPADTAVWMVAS